MFTLVQNTPINLSLISPLYEDREVLSRAWPEAIYPFNQEQWTEWFKETSKVKTVSLLLKFESDIVAHAAIKSYVIEPGLNYLCLIAVRKDLQSKGIGREFLKQIFLHCQNKLGISELYLMVHLDNQRALDFYTKLGFQWVDGENPRRLKIKL